MATMQTWDKWIYNNYAQGNNTPPPLSSNNGIINPAPNTSQANFTPAVAPAVPKAPTTYIPKTPSIQNTVPSATKTPAPAPAVINPQIVTPTANPQGLTAQGMGNLAQTQMENRVIDASQSSPGTVQTGAQMGKLADGTPIMFQAYTNGEAKSASTTQTGGTGETTQGGSETSGSSGGDQYVWDATAGGYVKPDTSAIDKELKDYYDPNRKIADAKSELDLTMNNIQMSYDNDVRNAMRDFENRKQEQFSNLAGIGTGINPLSSAGQSVASANEGLFQRFKANLDMERAAKESAAQKTFLGQKADAEATYIKYLEGERSDMLKEAEDDYNRSVNALKDMQDRVYKAKQIAAMDREATQDEEAYSNSVIEDYFKMAGSQAFAEMTDEEKRNLEKKAGKPAGYISATLKQVKAEEEAARAEKFKPQFKQSGNSVMQYVYNAETGKYDLIQTDSADNLKTIGKSVYNVTYDENGNPKMTLVPGSPGVSGGGVRSGGGGGGGSGSSVAIPKGFDADAQTQLGNLASGKQSWGSAFNSLKTQYPTVSNEVIDTFLNRNKWSQPGAYEKTKTTASPWDMAEAPSTPVPTSIGGSLNTNDEKMPWEL